MDLKGLAWIGNIYEKFEAMCLEVEEVMYQVNTRFCCLVNYIQSVLRDCLKPVVFPIFLFTSFGFLCWESNIGQCI